MTPYQAYLISMVGTPYKWGGANLLSGIDCSGLALLALRFTDLQIVGDFTAQSLHDHLKPISEPGLGAGCFAFYGPSLNSIVHVAAMIDEYRIIHAGGGDSRVKTREEAAQRGAVVRGDRVSYRKDLLTVLRPPYKMPL